MAAWLSWRMPSGPGSAGQGTFCATLRISRGRQEDRENCCSKDLNSTKLTRIGSSVIHLEAWIGGILINFCEQFLRAPQLLA